MNTGRKIDKSIDERYKTCSSCGKNKIRETYFYQSNSNFDADGKVKVCKQCVRANVDSNNIDSVKNMLLQLNRPFISSFWNTSVEEGKLKGKDPFGLYLKTVYMNHKDLTWLESDDANIVNGDKKKTPIVGSNNQPKLLEISPEDQKNREDVIRMVGYDPFEVDNENDKRHLYNKLVDMLDESTLEDSFKLPAVIEIVRGFNQLDKINAAINQILSKTDSASFDTGRISSLIASKEKMLKTLLALAKDNGISVNHNNNKSKGAGTLSGIIKQLHEKGISAAEINVYDIETCEGMQQVANISNRSIMEQLMLNENDYTEMIKDQRDIILSLTEKYESLEEENRLLIIKLKFSEIEDRKSAIFIDGETL
jgi:hypothetical protein